ncbi:hypothetical protein [Nocardia sp. NBC_01377]|uniref:hypothetical protein n=1 Tax=Nocardia sp. NBC_01377 TaxID=2903595 RepID=UPI00386F9B7B
MADRTILLTYAIGNMPGGRHQSAHHMLTYKGYRGTPPVHECSEDLQLMISVMVDMHRTCLQSWLGHPWDALTFVPSKERPDATHPVAALANATLPKFNFAAAPTPKFLMRPGPGSDIKRKMTADRFEVDVQWRERVDGKHVLIVDDTRNRDHPMYSAMVALGLG